MISEVEQVAGGYRVAFRLNAQAQRAQCFSPVFATLDELYAANPELAPATPEPTRPRRGRPPRSTVAQVAAEAEVPAETISEIPPEAVAEPTPPNGEDRHV